ncbi:MAG TPA: 2Fe-2S iron-sulfur cluster binding domain-containing protein [Candidatus Mcinerneyibacteriales bacterium]|nr:2Fe-2S iron-sulfur cluster binding domain-containing protein [Candidatus Mcinerneyibacteriales bacterium]
MLNELLSAVGILSAISAALSLLMVIADRTIANYGEVTVTINDEKKLAVQGGSTLLSTLMNEEIFIPSACGGRGSCGFCKVRVLEGAGEILPTELPHLSEEERRSSIRLSCQLKVKKDMRIEIPEELFNVKQFRGVVAGIRDLTYDIKEVTIRLLEPAEISFKAGQYIQLETPEYELADEPVYRAYSVSSVPSLKDTVELEIRRVPNGICTTYVHDYMKEGDTVTLNGPYGEFFLRDSDRRIVFIAGGSGNAPIKSILSDMAEKKNGRKALYFFGARTTKDLFLMEEMTSFEKKLDDFTYIPALSEPAEEDRWTGETGLITDVIEKRLEGGVETEAYLCGSPGMIAACIKVLTAKGIPEELIFYDKFA